MDKQSCGSCKWWKFRMKITKAVSSGGCSWSSNELPIPLFNAMLSYHVMTVTDAEGTDCPTWAAKEPTP